MQFNYVELTKVSDIITQVMESLRKHIGQRKTLCFLDLEGTQFSHEMIAIGVIKVDIRKDLSIRKIHKGYYTLVKSKNRIGKVVTDLTGITEAQVKANGVPFRVAVNDVKKYMGREFTKTLFITFGNHDLRILAQSLAYNLDVNKEDVQLMIKHSFDLSEFVSTYVKDKNNNALSLTNMLKVFNVEFEGTQHNALADALNLVYLYRAVLENRSILKNEYKNVLKMMRHLPEPIHDVILNLLANKTVSPEEFDKMIEETLK